MKNYENHKLIILLNRFVESAVYYAQTQNSFEEISLKYLELNDFSALRTYLTHKLKTLDPEQVFFLNRVFLIV